MISQFSSQNHGDLRKIRSEPELTLFPFEPHAQEPQNSTSLNNFFPKSFATHLETSHDTPVGKHCYGDY